MVSTVTESLGFFFSFFVFIRKRNSYKTMIKNVTQDDLHFKIRIFLEKKVIYSIKVFGKCLVAVYCLLSQYSLLSVIQSCINV